MVCRRSARRPRSSSTTTARPSSTPAPRPHGQGHLTSWSMIAAEETGIDMDKIDLRWGDTDLVPVGGGTMGSRSLQQGGAAVQQASIELVAKAKDLAAKLLEANVDDVVLDKDAGRVPRGRHTGGRPDVGRPRRRGQAGGHRPRRRHRVRGRRRDLPLRRPRRRGRGRHRHGPGAPRSATWRSTTPGGCSTRSSWRARSTAGSPRARPRPCSRSSATTTTATPSPATSPTTPSRRRPSCRASRSSTWRPRRPSTRSAPRASASRARSAPRRPCSRPCATPCGRLGVRHVDMPTTGEKVWQAIQAARSATS